MQKRILKAGDVVQLNPTAVANKAFAACFMTVTEPNDFGAHGYVQALGTRAELGGQAFYRAKWEEMEYVGRAEWVVLVSTKLALEEE